MLAPLAGEEECSVLLPFPEGEDCSGGLFWAEAGIQTIKKDSFMKIQVQTIKKDSLWEHSIFYLDVYSVGIYHYNGF